MKILFIFIYIKLCIIFACGKDCEMKSFIQTENLAKMSALASAINEYESKNNKYPDGSINDVLIELRHLERGVSYTPKLSKKGELTGTNGRPIILTRDTQTGWLIIGSVSDKGDSIDECVMIAPNGMVSELSKDSLKLKTTCREGKIPKEEEKQKSQSTVSETKKGSG